MGGAKKGPLPKIFNIYPTITKLGKVILYLKKIQKINEHVTHTLSSADISFFCNIRKCRYRLYFDTYFQILLTFFESLKIVLMKMVTILMMSAKLATKVPLKIKVFWNIGYDVIISIYNATNKILSLDSNYIVDVVTWPKFVNSSISMKDFYH